MSELSYEEAEELCRLEAETCICPDPWCGWHGEKMQQAMEDGAFWDDEEMARRGYTGGHRR